MANKIEEIRGSIDASLKDESKPWTQFFKLAEEKTNVPRLGSVDGLLHPGIYYSTTKHVGLSDDAAIETYVRCRQPCVYGAKAALGPSSTDTEASNGQECCIEGLPSLVGCEEAVSAVNTVIVVHKDYDIQIFGNNSSPAIVV
ncbi:hypothetical protein AND_005144 [Anopheles darlingi]|uniref:Uncharacterized protein n=1 Tax=Anopheles darlingi TaxID=43151 RepID=W5JGD7_ANODA|nr:hypothetical protein AND_005144 [Anopheles darlingi]